MPVYYKWVPFLINRSAFVWRCLSSRSLWMSVEKRGAAIAACRLSLEPMIEAVNRDVARVPYCYLATFPGVFLALTKLYGLNAPAVLIGFLVAPVALCALAQWVLPRLMLSVRRHPPAATLLLVALLRRSALKAPSEQLYQALLTHVTGERGDAVLAAEAPCTRSLVADCMIHQYLALVALSLDASY